MRLLLLQAVIIAALAVPVRIIEIGGNACFDVLEYPLVIWGLAVAIQIWICGLRSGRVVHGRLRAVLWCACVLALACSLLDRFTVFNVSWGYAYEVCDRVMRWKGPPLSAGQYWGALWPLVVLQVALVLLRGIIGWMVLREIVNALAPLIPYQWRRRWNFMLIAVLVGATACSCAQFWWCLQMFTVDWQRLKLINVTIPVRISAAIAAGVGAWIAIELIALFRSLDAPRAHVCPTCGYPAGQSRNGVCPECGVIVPPPMHRA
jgi:hypothetical protein